MRLLLAFLLSLVASGVYAQSCEDIETPEGTNCVDTGDDTVVIVVETDDGEEVALGASGSAGDSGNQADYYGPPVQENQGQQDQGQQDEGQQNQGQQDEGQQDEDQQEDDGDGSDGNGNDQGATTTVSDTGDSTQADVDDSMNSDVSARLVPVVGDLTIVGSTINLAPGSQLIIGGSGFNPGTTVVITIQAGAIPR